MATPLLDTQSDTRKRKSMEGSSSKVKSTEGSTKVLSIEVQFDKTLGQKIIDARKKLSEISVKALEMESHPTMTLFTIQASLPNNTLKKINEALHRLSPQLPKENILFSVLGTSASKGVNSDHSSLSILATPSIPLLKFHDTVYSVMELLDGVIVIADKPNSWMPKCFLGVEIPDSRMQEAYNILWHEFEFPIHGQLCEIGMSEVDMESGVKTRISFFLPSIMPSLQNGKKWGLW